MLKWAARFGGDGGRQRALAIGDAIVAQRLHCEADVAAVRRELAAALGVVARGGRDHGPADRLLRLAGLLVGETGCAKATACELLAAARGADLVVIKCNMQ